MANVANQGVCNPDTLLIRAKLRGTLLLLLIKRHKPYNHPVVHGLVHCRLMAFNGQENRFCSILP